MGENAILEELKYIHQLLDESIHKMDEILRPRMGNVLWRVFFPAGQFMQQKSITKEAAAILINIGTRLQEMIVVLEERKHPLTPTIQSQLNVDIFVIADKLVELPERAQYFIPTIEDFQKRIEEIIKKIESKE
ncbi:MAG: hypothetical protein JSW11_07790 [Candidatus Heimdallarchaeota archaeon]|nr:MAG: hypothetical protein JSW11_07790 [Candidatus Heimdallarchaeota archaeon]